MTNAKIIKVVLLMAFLSFVCANQGMFIGKEKHFSK